MRFSVHKVCLGLLILAQITGAGMASAAAESDWPCVQRKIPEISPAAVWAGPPLDRVAERWRRDPAVAPLVERLAARRTPVEEAEREIVEVARLAGDAREQKLLILAAGLLDTLNAERADVIAGIERYGVKQRQLAEKLRRDRSSLDAMQDDPVADPAKVAEANDQLTWDLRIFDDRQQSLSFVCEVPVLIEQRLFQLLRTVQDALD